MASTSRIGPKNPVRVFICQWREHIGLTQEQLADRLGVTKSTISRWEGSKRIPSINVLAAICEGLDIPIRAIWNPPPPPRGAKTEPAELAQEFSDFLAWRQQNYSLNSRL
jgi:transcriptional regulator with XRE-family HTH domain